MAAIVENRTYGTWFQRVADQLGHSGISIDDVIADLDYSFYVKFVAGSSAYDAALEVIELMNALNAAKQQA